MFPLKKGSKGEEVKRLQLYLQDKYKVEFPAPQGANGFFGDKTAEYVKQHLGVEQVSEAMYNNLVNSGKMGKALTLTDGDRRARQDRTVKFVDTGANLLGQFFGYKTAREQAKAAASNAQNPSMQMPYFPQPTEQPRGMMPMWLKVGLGILLLGIIVAIVVALSKKDAPAEAE